MTNEMRLSLEGSILSSSAMTAARSSLRDGISADIRAVAGSETPVSAFAGNRKHTVLAYGLIFGADNKVANYSDLSLGAVSNVTRHHMLLGDKRAMRATVLQSENVREE